MVFPCVCVPAVRTECGATRVVAKTYIRPTVYGTDLNFIFIYEYD